MRNFLISIFILLIPLENLFSYNYWDHRVESPRYIATASFYYHKEFNAFLSYKLHFLDLLNSEIIHSRVLEYLYLNNVNLDIIGPLDKKMMNDKNKNKLIYKLNEMVSIHSGSLTDIYKIEVAAKVIKDKKINNEVISLINIYLDILSEYLLNENQQYINDQIEFLNEKVNIALMELEASESEYNKFKLENPKHEEFDKLLKLNGLRQIIQNRKKVYLMLKQELEENIIKRESTRMPISIIDGPKGGISGDFIQKVPH